MASVWVGTEVEVDLTDFSTDELVAEINQRNMNHKIAGKFIDALEDMGCPKGCLLEARD